MNQAVRGASAATADSAPQKAKAMSNLAEAKRVKGSPGIRMFTPPLLDYGFHRPAPVAFSAAPISAALSASAGQWPASPVIRLPSPTARSPIAAAPWYAGTTTQPIPPFPKPPSSSPPGALRSFPAPPTRTPATARLPPHHAPAWLPRYRPPGLPDAAAAPPTPASAP